MAVALEWILVALAWRDADRRVRRGRDRLLRRRRPTRLTFRRPTRTSRCARERVGREREPRHGACLVAVDHAEQLAALPTLDTPPEVVALGLEERELAARDAVDEIGLQPATEMRDDDLVALRPPDSEDTVELGGDACRRDQRSGARGGRLVERDARRDRARACPGAAPALVPEQHRRTDAFACGRRRARRGTPASPRRGRRRPARRAGRDATPRPQPTVQRVGIDERDRPRHLVHRCLREHAVGAGREKSPQRARSATVDQSQPAADVVSVTAGSTSVCRTSEKGSTK